MWVIDQYAFNTGHMSNFKSLRHLHQELEATKTLGFICALYWEDVAFGRVRVNAWTTQYMPTQTQQQLAEYLRLWYSHSIFNIFVEANKITFYINQLDMVNWELLNVIPITVA